MKKWKVIVLAAAVASVLFAGVATRGYIREGERVPGLVAREYSQGDVDCFRVLEVRPPIHWSWVRMAYETEPNIMWENVEVYNPPPTVTPHHNSGPVQVGDTFCGLALNWHLHFIREDWTS